LLNIGGPGAKGAPITLTIHLSAGATSAPPKHRHCTTCRQLWLSRSEPGSRMPSQRAWERILALPAGLTHPYHIIPPHLHLGAPNCVDAHPPRACTASAGGPVIHRWPVIPSASRVPLSLSLEVPQAEKSIYPPVPGPGATPLTSVAGQRVAFPLPSLLHHAFLGIQRAWQITSRCPMAAASEGVPPAFPSELARPCQKLQENTRPSKVAARGGKSLCVLDA
jgi:hypothetical protein